MMATPLVSVLMTSYNREKYISTAIESVLASTYTNFELIVVDDCSTDRTVEIVKSYAERDKRVRLYINERNLGQFGNRNLAAKYANGKFLKYLDSDDYMYPTGLEVLVNMMEKFPEAGYGLCSLLQDDYKIYPFVLTPKEAYERHFCKSIPLFHKAPLSSIIRKEIFLEVGGFTNPHGEGDYDLWLNLSTHYKVVLMPDGVVWYRVHEEQIDFLRRKDPFIRFRYFLTTLKYLVKGCPLGSEQTKQIVEETHINMVKYILMSLVKYSPYKALLMYKAAEYNFIEFVRLSFKAFFKKLVK